MIHDREARDYLESAVRFRPLRRGPDSCRRIRVARTLLTCGIAAALLNEMKMRAESGATYRFVNVHNPRCPLRFEEAHEAWRCDAALQRHPVWGINWAGARLLCDYLGARLPSVVEWECFASNNAPGRPYPWGRDDPHPSLANYDEHYGGTSEVTTFPPSEIGLHDLAGNLGEWCLDHFVSGGAASAFERTVKGGAWSKDARYLRISCSRGKWERLGTTTIGLRPVWDDG
ncbi:MAG TPA: SUMF1/EgtB/PvdO family nonheme iron enzyme [Burkholderiaceae bacterium]|nr:SUMF1/EgtB/PvdO family nonheme iron enzyme [Burkholderiaceae bacterium]